MNPNNAPNNTMYEPKPLYFKDNAEPVLWACSKCGWFTPDRDKAAWCCDPHRCTACQAQKAKPSRICAECEAKHKAQTRAQQAQAQFDAGKR